jgi:putative endonuclease
MWLRMQRSAARAELGRRGEQLAVEHLERAGFSIVARNARVGRLELDVIAQRGPLIVICEVRARSSDRVMTPAQSVDYRKVSRVRLAAVRWLKEAELPYSQLRFDVASIVFERPAGRLSYFEGAF